ncbi:hypothetical protein JCM19297_2238 [Nonlabens ulvanivorans]|nr:hypothetical protein JCM19297_2238 [Nonlabens ulvanivorans]
MSSKKKYSEYYTDQDLAYFERRLRLRVNIEDEKAVESFLMMYARPVFNKEKLAVVDEA